MNYLSEEEFLDIDAFVSRRYCSRREKITTTRQSENTNNRQTKMTNNAQFFLLV